MLMTRFKMKSALEKNLFSNRKKVEKMKVEIFKFFRSADCAVPNQGPLFDFLKKAKIQLTDEKTKSVFFLNFDGFLVGP